VIFGLKNHAPDDYREKSEMALSGGDKPIQVETPDERAARARAIVAEAFAVVTQE
jgi:hypothetical protein